MHRLLPTALLLVAACTRPGTPSLQGSPVTATAADPGASERVFEMRTYITRPGRLVALQARFRNHTLALFEKHGMQNVGYWVPQDSARRDNTLIYIVSHASRAQADRNWAAFGADPEWVRVRTESEKDGVIIERIERTFLTATDYSPMR